MTLQEATDEERMLALRAERARRAFRDCAFSEWDRHAAELKDAEAAWMCAAKRQFAIKFGFKLKDQNEIPLR